MKVETAFSRGTLAAGSNDSVPKPIARFPGGTMPWHDEELWDDSPFEFELEA